MKKILIITPVKHIKGVIEILEKSAELKILEDPDESEVLRIINEYDALFTNPNKSNIYIGSKLIKFAKKLKVVCTASTGTNHIDKETLINNKIELISLTEEREIINKISSTAELAFGLTLSCLRNIITGHKSVMEGQWDYTKFIGRQMNFLTIGIIGFGRLGEIYANYCNAFGAKILIYDPYKKIKNKSFTQVESMKSILEESNIISLHVHVSKETIGLISKNELNLMKKDVILINTSRGDIINEIDLVSFLQKNPASKVGTDVLADEVVNRKESPLLLFAKTSNQVTITPHIGGMTKEAQEIAFCHAANKLAIFLKETL